MDGLEEPSQPQLSVRRWPLQSVATTSAAAAAATAAAAAAAAAASTASCAAVPRAYDACRTSSTSVR